MILAAEPQNLGLWDGVQALDFAAQMGWSAGCLATRKPGSASGANLAVRRDVYRTPHLGASGDDTLVIQALQHEGWEVDWLSDPRAVVKTEGGFSFIVDRATASLGWKNQTLSLARTTNCVVDGHWPSPNGSSWVPPSCFPMGPCGRSPDLVDGCDGAQRVVCATRCRLVWAEREGYSLGGSGPDPTFAGPAAAHGKAGAAQICRHPFSRNVERPNLHFVTAFLSHRMALVGAAWILLWVTVAMVGSPLRPDPSPMANMQHLDVA